MGKTKPNRTAVAIAAVVLAALAGCAEAPATTTPSSGSPTPTAACPTTGTEPQQANCIAYDGDAAMAQNDMYRQRRKLTPEMLTQLNQHVKPARKALAAVPRPFTGNDVEAALTSIGLMDIRTDNGGKGVRFGAAVRSGGCIYGFVPNDGEPELATGGPIMDGGCLEMLGH
ncbi:hypothetical protein IG195_11240 [Arthrobacter sp. TES]|uniref:hypothetical protein n=1 Tax=Paenarthrobacter ureafaciens TaxID=37931 RepID=UPI00039757F5|nr:hypothetical protein [Paenarthrobacter ureafaciens]AOY69831.1 hypothetical protein ARZXY2_264 [Arthrobacter sp. ZXY-2]ERI36604.1 hypothetical protein M707_16100 [Arthrobacter sp. AK-YN10]QOI62165.1 hypothetical protein IG195_11240 [Arthrobacter sp. TES]MCX8455662.1 hypothetical protein [Paenarthrobacter ureafaciens]MCY0973854.1 hypothetical protein [Paenarthrobacter ureafaciens]